MKIKIYATGNENLGKFNVSYYIIEKSNKFLDWLSKLVGEVLNGKNMDVKYYVEYDEEDNEVIYSKDIKKMTDVHEHYEDKNGKNRVDVFYGKERVYITFRKDKEMRKKFGRFLMKNTEWIKPKKKIKKKYLIKK